MRPLQRNDARLDQQDNRLTAPSTSNGSHMSFIITDEPSLDSHTRQCFSPAHPRSSKKAPESPFRAERDHWDELYSYPSSSKASFFSQSPVSLPSSIQPSTSRPMTPITLGPSRVGSTGSTSSSRRDSLASFLSEQSFSYDKGPIDEPALGPSMLDNGNAPQLVMPSIHMPSRRPFTEIGKNLGRLKILLAGDNGIGKTTLLNAIVQTCRHIVHIDTISPGFESSPAPLQPRTLPISRNRRSLSTLIVSEIHASTKPYPEWWQELDAPHASRKRKSSGDSVLERNICFVDTPGYGRESSVMETVMSCVDYVESHLSKVSSDDLSDSDLMNMLGGDGGCQVDAVLYLISHRGLKPADLEYIRRLVPLTNVIPILARADLLSREQTTACKQQIARQLRSAGIQPFTFTPTTVQEGLELGMPSIPYTVSSATVSDHDILDASLLMSPDYVQPLVPTDLGFLVEKIFSIDGAAWLRHSAATKYLQWRELTPHRPQNLYRPLAFAAPDHQSALVRLPQAVGRHLGSRQREETTQYRVVDWATELQRSLVNDRQRCRTLRPGEHEARLTGRLNEGVCNGAMVAMRNNMRGTTTSVGRWKRKRGTRSERSETQKHQDPLGLIQAVADLKARGWVAVEVLGSLSILGLALWISRHSWPVTAIKMVDF